MDICELMKLPSVAEMFPAGEDGQLSEEGRLLLSSMEEVWFEPGQDLVTCGQPGDDGMYILLEGSAGVFDGAGEAINTPMKAGSIVGEMALMRDEPRGATVRAMELVRAMRLPKDRFEDAARYNRRLYGALLSLAYRQTTGLVREQARIHSELEIAARIQAGLLRRDFGEFEEKMGLKAEAMMEPAKEVGGDFYDMFLIPGGKAGIVMADVSGKGVPAAMFMAAAKTNIRNYGMLDMPLRELAYRVNNQLCEDNPEEMFVTAFVGTLDGDTGLLTFVNAGHSHPFVEKPRGGFKLLDCRSNLVFGLFENQEYQEQVIDLSRGGRLFLYTDGVTDAEDPFGDMFGYDGLQSSLNRAVPTQGPGGVIRGIVESLKDFTKGAGQTDDITMLCVEAKPVPAGKEG